MSGEVKILTQSRRAAECHAIGFSASKNFAKFKLNLIFAKKTLIYYLPKTEE